MTLRLVLAYAFVVIGSVAVARWMNRTPDRISIILFAMLPVVFLLPGFVMDRTPAAVDHVLAYYTPWSTGAPHVHNGTLNDVATQFVPWTKAVRMAWKSGSLPLRDRWNGCGMALAANGSSAAFSPFTFLGFATSLGRSFVLVGAAKLFLALFGTWLWLREIGASTIAARLGAIAFAFSFAMTPWLFHPAPSDLCLWPWIFFAIERLADPSAGSRPLAVLVGLFTVWPLCGHLETVAIGALFGTLWLLTRTLLRDLPSPRLIWTRTLLAAFFALGLSAFSLVPQFITALASNRLALARSPDHFAFVPWVPYRPGWLGGFVTSILPRAFGDTVDSPMVEGAAGSIVEMGFGYFGVVPWAIALLVFRPGSPRRRVEWAFLALLVFGLAAGMGIFPFRFLVEHLPAIGLAPPLRFLIFVSAAGAPLAALELDRLIKDFRTDPRSRRFALAATLLLATTTAVATAFLWPRHAASGGLESHRAAFLAAAVPLLAWGVALTLAHRLPPAGLVWIATALTAGDLLLQGARLYRYLPVDQLFPDRPLLRFLGRQPGAFRIVGNQHALFPNTNVAAGIENVQTHDPAERRDYVEFMDAGCGYPPFDYFKSIRNLNCPALDFLNVRFLVAPAGQKTPGEKWALVYSAEDGSVFENLRALPRVFAPQRVRFVATNEPVRPWSDSMRIFGPDLQRLLLSGRFREEALILHNHSDSRADERVNGAVRISNYREETNSVLFHALGGETPALVVLSLLADGNWSARDESGRQLPVTLANGPFISVEIPPGDHDIVLHYGSFGLLAGSVVSAATALALAGSIFLKRLLPG